MRHDLHYAVLFHEEIDKWRKSGNFPIEVDTYESQFDSVIIHIEKVDKLTTYVTHSKNSELNVLQQLVRKKRKHIIFSAYSTSEQAKFIQYFTSILCMLLLIVGSIIIIRKITFQVSRLLKSMSEFVNSNYESNESIVKELPKNEIGQIAVHFIKMARKIRSEVLLLEDRVQRRTLSLEQKNGLLEQQHEEMMESLRYAQNLQQSMLVSRQQLLHHFSDARIHYSPKQHVGGDFFWMKEIKNSKEDKILFALADCTGHGVPGALLSVLGINTLDELFRSGISQPDSLLTALRETIVRRLNMQQDQCMDGMDIALVLWDKKSNELQFAGAQLPVWILRQGEIVELKGDRMPIGFTHHESNAYSLQKIQLEFGDRLLFFTDGLVDQFGMVSEKKMGKKQLRFLLYKHLHESSVTIFNKVMSHFQFWKGTSEQTDDCTIIILEPLLKKPHRSKKQVEEKLLAIV
jgi:sigma-B regulation protein RsbU (phosphoserine phosphatase)